MVDRGAVNEIRAHINAGRLLSNASNRAMERLWVTRVSNGYRIVKLTHIKIYQGGG